MSEKSLKLGQKVQIIGKNVTGKIAYIGKPQFASGKWIGVILEAPKGKNNGTIKGQTYFTCEANHGVFVRPSQLVPILRSELASPKLKVMPSTSSNASIVSSCDNVSSSKRSSFVETGFIEILRPHFTLGQPLRSPSFTVVTDYPQQIEDNKRKLADLNSQLEEVLKERTEDRLKIKDFERMAIQFDQLTEFKVKIMEAHTTLQRDLQRAKKDLKDALDSKNRQAKELNELMENIELITLDREMAEEKTDTLQMELDDANEKIEELTIDLQIVKGELENKTRSIATSTPLEVKQLEQQNYRLKETLIRLRDTNAYDKNQIQKLSKELDVKKSEIHELQHTKQKLSTKVDELELQILDLCEQVDAAIGTEEMVETLADKKLELEERVKQLEEDIVGLEAMEEIHEQLLENNNELETELREELEKINALNRELLHEKEAAIETLYDRDITILKFRELVQNLNEHINTLSKATSEIIPMESPIKCIDLKEILADSKTHARTIDLQLRDHQAQEHKEFNRMLLDFLPDHIKTRDVECIELILLITRMVFKCKIIQNQVFERFEEIEDFDRDEIFQGYAVHQYAFKSRFLHYLSNVQFVVHQMTYSLSVCPAENLLETANFFSEIQLQEKIVDYYVDLLKNNNLDEHVSTDNLEKTFVYLQAVHCRLIGEDNLYNENLVIRDTIESLKFACNSIQTDATIIQSIIRIEDEVSESYLLLQYFINSANGILKILKVIKPRICKDPSVIKIGFAKTKVELLRDINYSMTLLVRVLYLSLRTSLGRLQTAQNNDFSIAHQDFWEIIMEIMQDYLDFDERDAATYISEMFINANVGLAELNTFLIENEGLIATGGIKSEVQAVPPIIQRTIIIKKELEQCKILQSTLDNRDAEIKSLKLAIKGKQNDISEMQIRRDIAEKRISVLQYEYDRKLERLKNGIDDAKTELQKKHEDYEKNLEDLQLKVNSFKLSRSPSEDLISSSNVELLFEEIKFLRSALLEERSQRIRVQAVDMKTNFKRLEPIFVPNERFEGKRLEKLSKFRRDLNKIKHEWIISYIKSSKLDGEFRRNKTVVENSKTLANEILQDYLKVNPHRAAKCDFGDFPNIEFTKYFERL